MSISIKTLKDGARPDSKLMEVIKQELKNQGIETGRKKILSYIWKDDSDHVAIEETLKFEDIATGIKYQFYIEWGQSKNLSIIE